MIIQIQTLTVVILTFILLTIAEKRDGDEGEDGSHKPSCHDCFHCYCRHSHCPASSRMTSLKDYCQHQGHVNCSEHYDVDGGWSHWQTWGACAGSCSHGSRKRLRSCSNPRPANCGSLCHGSDNQIDTRCRPAHCYTTDFTRCSKLCSVSAVVNKHSLTHKNATSCPGNNAGSPEALPLHCCGDLDLHNCQQGIKVMQNCATFPKYTVVAVVGSTGIDWNTIGIFVGCLPRPEVGFQLIRQDCTQPPNLVHVSTTQTVYGSPYDYSAIF